MGGSLVLLFLQWSLSDHSAARLGRLGSADTVVRAMNAFNAFNGKCRFSRYASSETTSPIFKKNWHSWLRRGPHPTRKFWDQSVQRGRVCACVKLSSSGVYFFLFLISCASLQVGLLDRSPPLTAQTTQPVGVHIPYMVSIITINIFPVCLWWCQFALRVKIALPWFDIYRSQSPSQLSPFVTCCLPCAWSLASSLSARQCPRIQGTSTYWR